MATPPILGTGEGWLLRSPSGLSTMSRRRARARHAAVRSRDRKKDVTARNPREYICTERLHDCAEPHHDHEAALPGGRIAAKCDSRRDTSVSRSNSRFE